jgi:hypothetical protein
MGNTLAQFTIAVLEMILYTSLSKKSYGFRCQVSGVREEKQESLSGNTETSMREREQNGRKIPATA